LSQQKRLCRANRWTSISPWLEGALSLEELLDAREKAELSLRLADDDDDDGDFDDCYDDALGSAAEEEEEAGGEEQEEEDAGEAPPHGRSADGSNAGSLPPSPRGGAAGRRPRSRRSSFGGESTANTSSSVGGRVVLPPKPKPRGIISWAGTYTRPLFGST
jgi:hypothetical protein